MKKGHKPADELGITHLVPTKAALFGLDVRFRVIEKKLLDEKIARSAFAVKKNKTTSDSGNHHDKAPENRHMYPSEDKIT
jgi:hypothetical protein